MDETLRRRHVHVVDDDPSVRDSLRALLSAHGFRTSAYASAEEFLAAFDPSDCLCVLLDLRMNGMGGVELHRRLQSMAMPVPVAILTAHGDVPLAVEAMKAGAVDFIEKPGSEAQILGAVEAAANKLTNRPLHFHPPEAVAERLGRLTQREREVLEHLVLGMTNKSIADVLGISQRTVEIHRARIREKMEARGLSDLIRMMR